MSRVAVIGEALRVQGFVLAGALVLAAERAAERAAWRSCRRLAVGADSPAADVCARSPVLTPTALAAGLAGRHGDASPDGWQPPGVLPVVMPGEASQGPAVTPP